MSEIRSQATPAADEYLFEDFHSVDLPNTYYHQDDGYGTPAIRPATRSEAATNAMDVVRARGWTPPPRMVNCLEELDALPIGSVLARNLDDPDGIDVYVKRSDLAGHRYLPTPLVVLFTPGDAG